MRNGIRRHFDIADSERLTITANPDIDALRVVVRRGFESPVTEPDRNAIAPGQLEHPADMIGMLVCDENAGQLSRIDLQPAQASLHFLQAETAIDHHAGS